MRSKRRFGPLPPITDTRKFESTQDEGWYVYQSKVPGWVVKLGIKYAVQFGIYVSTGGITFDAVKMDDAAYERKIKKLTKNGQLILSQNTIDITIGTCSWNQSQPGNNKSSRGPFFIKLEYNGRSSHLIRRSVLASWCI